MLGMLVTDNTTRFIKRQFPQLSPSDCAIAAGTLERAILKVKWSQLFPQHLNLGQIEVGWRGDCTQLLGPTTVVAEPSIFLSHTQRSKS
ncbi:MAG: hypothetical protein NT018_01230 [Armatimonadetes bacterium]|nr:hypothetical protein [Armatimonadota bacterium]